MHDKEIRLFNPELTQEDIDCITNRIKEILSKNDNAIPIFCSPPIVKMSEKEKKSWEEWNKLEKMRINLRYRQLIIIPAVRHYMRG